MARTKEFNRDEALQRAMEVFRDKGYQAASLQDLVAHMGIGRASLYDTFGSKHELFCESMDRYAEVAEQEFLAPLLGAGSPRKRLNRFFKGLVERYAGEDAPTCLAAKAALTVCRDDDTTRAKVCSFLERLEDVFHDVIREARAAGEIGASVRPRATARFLASSVHGLGVTASVRPGVHVLRDITRTALRVLDA